MSTTVTSRTEADPPRTSKARPGTFRRDIEGLRSVAILLVLIYHAGVTALPGGFVGVDVFFVISGFLITGLIVREIEATGRLSLVRFYARRARRLLPATVLVLVTSAILTWFFLPVTQRDVFGLDIAAAAFYVVNWVLAARSVDYLAEGVAASPVQHFWSLAVEEQFYVVWPLVIVLLLVLARRLRMPIRRTLSIGLALVVVPSFVWSLHLTANVPAEAYFVTTTRLWELGIGAAAALALPLWERMGRSLSGILALVGIAMIIGSALLLDASTAWPGWHAALPVFGAALVVIGGAAQHETLVARALGTAPFVWVGSISYSLYLWHWPLLVAAGAYWDGLSMWQGLVVAACSFAPAWLSLRLVENPIRHSVRLAASHRLTLQVGAASMVLGLVAGIAIAAPAWLSGRGTETGTGLGDQAIPAGAVEQAWDVSGEVPPFSPDPLRATDDVPVSYDEGCQSTSRDVATCTYGDVDAELEVALVGDSMALQWQPTLDLLGKDRGFRVTTYTKSACPFVAATRALDGAPFDDCRAWGDDALEQILRSKPDVVLTSQGSSEALAVESDADSSSEAAMIDGLVGRWTELSTAGITVIALAKNPVPPGEVYECVAQNADNLAECSFPADEPVAKVQAAAAARVPGVQMLSLNDRICPAGTCPAVIGGVLLYRQGSHLTKTYVESTVDSFGERLDAVLPEQFRRSTGGAQ